MATAYLFIGNPGAGKSTLANIMAGEVLFTSGTTCGSGCTTRLESKTDKDGREFIDTPGLNDAVRRKEAAAEISAALKKGGTYKIVFVLLNVQGRVRPEDVTTMKLVLDASDEIEEGKFGILINQNTAPFMNKMENDAKRLEFETIVQKHLPRKTSFILYIQTSDKLNGYDNTIVPMDEVKGFKMFMDTLPCVNLTQDKADNIDGESFEDKNEALKTKQQELIDLQARADAGEAESQRKIAEMTANHENQIKNLKEKTGGFNFWTDFLLPVVTLGTSKIVEAIAKK